MKLLKMQKQNSFMAVRNLLADALILNLKLQKEYDFLKVNFEGSELEKDYVKLDTRYKNEKHLLKIKR
jgi:hypothetical protein